MTFSIFSFDRRIDAGIKSCGYTAPTPIQSQTIPLILKGHDVMGLAQTGTGKTAAFALPILQALLTNRARPGAPRVLVLAPTRELALQINANFHSLGSQTGIRSCAVIGGVAMGPQIKALRSSHVIVACPGRLVGLMTRGVVNLRDINTLVLDEADRMLDMGFMPDIKRIIGKLPPKRQNLLFSATMPKDILAFAKRILVNPETVQINASSPVKSVEHVFYRTHAKSKGAVLETLLSKSEYKSMLIFTRTKHKAKSLCRKLANNGYNATFLQGNMSQNQRERALNGFKKGRFTIMVATDIAARGIDCDRITHVINFDMPDTAEAYTHRIGRTGRAGRSGSAISLVTPDDASQLRAIERVMKITIEQQAVEGVQTRGNVQETKRGPRPSVSGKKGQYSRRNKSGRGRRNAA